MKQKKSLTKEQRDALNLNLHISLNANAGSGKTSVLVERYFSILEKAIRGELDVSPDEIVAITFTRKASAEMLSRIIKRFNSAFETTKPTNLNQEVGLDYIEKVRTIRNKLTNARISTIHSFCLQILSNYPIEADIPVNFREISESERLQLLDDAFNTTLMEWLDSPEKKTTLGKILSNISLADLRNLTQKVISNIDLWNDLQKLYSKSFDEYLQVLAEFFGETYHKCFNLFIQFFDTFFETYDGNEKIQEITTQIATFLRYSKEVLQDKVNFSNALFDFEAWNNYLNFINAILTKDKKPRKRYFNEDVYEEIASKSREFAKMFAFFDKIINLNSFKQKVKEKSPEFNVEQRYFETSKAIFSFIQDVNNNFRKLKYDEGFIDFSDMLLKTNELFERHKNILEEVRNGIKFLLVDEFQDTDQLQFDIIRQLVPNEKNIGKIPNLFIVGDEKQSIYSFRNADVRVFQDAKFYIVELNDNNEDAWKLDFGKLKLTQTFRLKPEIAGFVDRTIGNLMLLSDAEPFSEFNIDYEPFVIPEIKLQQYQNPNAQKVAPITFLFEKTKDESIQTENSNATENGQENQANNEETPKQNEYNKLDLLIARHINFIVENDEAQIYDKDIESFRTVNFSDIAILSRKIKDLAKIASVFASQNIPFIFQGGKNFFSAREIQDIISFLRFLVNPKNDVALVSILRSVFFGFTDEDLLNISTSANDVLPFWNKLTNYFNILKTEENAIGNPDSELLTKINYAINVIERLRQLVSILPINELIHRILVETEWHKKVRGFKNFEQILANVDELLDYSREYVSLGFRTILDFIDDIDFISKSGISDADRFGFVSSNAVRLLTIHSAKGLEFPVVYLYRIDSEPRTKENIDVSRQIGLIFPMVVYLDNEVHKAPTLQNLLASTQLEIEQEAEELRLLYVATTRASDFLIITGSVAFNDKNECKTKYHLQKILEAIKLKVANKSSERISCDFEIKILKENDILEKAKINVPIDYYIDSFNQEKAKVAKAESETSVGQKEIIKLIEKIQPEISRNIFSSTKFNIYSVEPKNYIKSYFLGIHSSLSEIMKTSFDEEFETKDNLIISSIIGNTIHFCMENVSYWFSQDNFYIDKLIETIENSMFQQERLLSRDIQNLILEQCSNIVQTKLFKQYKDIILHSPKEFEILLPLGNDFLTAKIDLLFKNPSGEFEIWDWKSNNIKSATEMPDYAEYYRQQMETYALALSFLYPEQQTFRAKLLFTKLARPDINDSDWTYEFCWNKADLRAIESHLTSLITKMNNLEV